MISGQATINNRVGLHLAAASCVVEAAMRFKCKITVAKDKKKKRNARSVLDLLMLEAVPGTVLTVEADGEDEAEALAAVLDVFEKNFGEK